MRIDHIQLTMPLGGEEKARSFFVGLLTMQEEVKPEPLMSRGGCWFRSEGTIIHMGIEEEFAPQRKAHPAFTIEDIDRVASNLVNQKYSVQWDNSLPDKKRFYTNDPFGNRLEFIQSGDGFSDRPSRERKAAPRKNLAEITLHPKKTKYLLVAGICMMFVLGGLLMAIDGDWIGYLAMAFFGLGIPVCLFQIVPGSSYLRIHRDGFEHASLFRKYHVRWDEITEFGVFKRKQSGITVVKSVGFNYVTSYPQKRMLRSINKQVSGYEGALSDNFGKTTEELLELMQSYWEEAKRN